MAPGLEGLRSNLEQEADTQERIRVLLAEKLDAVMKGNTRRLESVVAKLESELSSTQVLQRDRQEMLGDLAKELGIQEEAVSFDSVVQRLSDDSMSEPLLEKRLHLKSLAKDVQSLNHQCQLLVRDSVAFLDEVLDQIHGVSGRVPVYGMDGAIEKRAATSWVNRRG